MGGSILETCILKTLVLPVYSPQDDWARISPLERTASYPVHSHLLLENAVYCREIMDGNPDLEQHQLFAINLPVLQLRFQNTDVINTSMNSQANHTGLYTSFDPAPLLNKGGLYILPQVNLSSFTDQKHHWFTLLAYEEPLVDNIPLFVFLVFV